MVRWTTSRSSGSFCWSAKAALLPNDSSASAASATLFRHPRANECQRIIERELGAFGVAPPAIFELAGIDAALAHDQPVRNADELRVREFDARAGIAVVEEHFDAGGVELRVQFLGNFANTF